MKSTLLTHIELITKFDGTSGKTSTTSDNSWSSVMTRYIGKSIMTYNLLPVGASLSQKQDWDTVPTVNIKFHQGISI